VKPLPTSSSRRAAVPRAPTNRNAGTEGPEELIVNLRAFDCVTFVENAIVLARLIHAGKTHFADYLAPWRGFGTAWPPGRVRIPPPLLTDWLFDNGRKESSGTSPFARRVSFQKSFHQLTDRARESRAEGSETFRRLRLVEGICSRRLHSSIPKADLTGIEHRIADGTSSRSATDEQGIDVSHTGLAVASGKRSASCMHRPRRKRLS